MTDERADDTTALPPAGMPPDASDRELFEARITAYAVGQLTAVEAAEIERLLADPARKDERRQVDEIRRLAATIRYAPDETAPARSAALRRAVLAAAAAAPQTAATPARPASRRWAWPLFAAVGSLAAALLVAATIFFGRPADRMVAMHDQAKKDASERETVPMAAAAAPPPMPETAAPPALAADRAAANADGVFDAAKAESREKLRGLAAGEADTDKQGSQLESARSRRETLSRKAAADKPQALGKLLAKGGAAEELREAGLLAASAPQAKPAMELPSEQSGVATPGETSNAASGGGSVAASDPASYAEVRRFLAAGRLPPRDAVRIEELVNSFHYDYPPPEGDAAFSVTVDAAACPWKPGHRLVRIGVRSRDAVDGMPEALEDVAIRVEFNPSEVASHRLLGFKNEVLSLAVRDFHIGEAGAPRSLTALYEITLAGVEAVVPAGRQELLTVKLRWKRPNAEESKELEVPLADRGPEFAEAPADLRFAAAVAAFGMILQGSDQRGEATIPLVAKIAADAIGHDDGGHRAEFLDLVRRAESAR